MSESKVSLMNERVAPWAEGNNGWYLVGAIFLFSMALWLPAIFTPFWGDDYVLLQAAKAARIHGEPWWLPFWPEAQTGFWRPLSADSYFRFVETVLNANVKLAHLLNLLLWFVSCSAVGLFAFLLGQRMHWPRPLLLGALTSGIYGLSSIHILSVHWISAANSSFIVLFTALAMAVWVVASKSEGRLRLAMCLLLPLIQILALLSKESSVLIPVLLLCITAFATKKINLAGQKSPLG